MTIQTIGGTLHGELFTYAGGPTVPVQVLSLLAGLDVRGIRFQANGERLRVYREDEGAVVYEDGERDLIVRYKLHILAILGVIEGQMAEPEKVSRYEKPTPKQPRKRGST